MALVPDTSVVIYLCLAFVVGVSSAAYKRGCYYTNWAQYRSSPYTYTPKDIEPFLCTHIFYSFLKMNSIALTIEPYEWNDNERIGQVVGLKNTNPELKVYGVVGGWNAASTDLSSIVASEASITTFAKNVIVKLREWKLDGFDVDWEFPGAVERGSSPADKQRFTTLLRILRSEFTLESQTSGKPPLDLIIAVSSSPWFANRAYEHSTIHQYLDFINVMSYDLAGTWLPSVQHHSALYPATSFSSDWDMERAIDYWIGKGVPANKLMLGLSTYARNFVISSGTQHAPGSPSHGAGGSGEFTGMAGFQSYYEMCNYVKNKGWVSVWSDEQSVPYAYGQIYGAWNWAGYDTPRSFTEKSKYVKTRGLAGVFVWSLDFDDFNGEACGQGSYPLLNAIKNELTDEGVDTTTSPTTSPTTPPTTWPTTSPTTSATTPPTTSLTTLTTTPPTTSPTTSATTPPITSATTTTTNINSATTSPTTTTSSPTTSPTKSPTTSPTTSQTTTSTNMSGKFVPSCGVNGYGGNPNDCTIFYHCAHNVVYTKHCPPGLAFDSKLLICNWPYLVPGCN